ncbi:MAG: dodecin family protein [Pseudomonadales bacterium]
MDLTIIGIDEPPFIAYSRLFESYLQAPTYVIDVRGDISDGKVAYWQVTLKVGFTLDDNSDSQLSPR